MADGTVTLPDGTKIDNTVITRADATVVERQRVTIGHHDTNLQDVVSALTEVRDAITEMQWTLLQAFGKKGN